MLKCSKCGEMKDESEFCRAYKIKRGFTYWCKSCKKAYNQQYMKKKPKKPKLKHCFICGEPFYSQPYERICRFCKIRRQKREHVKKTRKPKQKIKRQYRTQDNFEHGRIYVLENVEAEDDKEAWHLEVRP